MLPPGTVIDGKYEVRGRLGSGGMGEVYHATRVLLGDDVAVKIVRPVGGDPETLRERFLRESRTNARLRHPNIVGILDFSVDPAGRPYLVMEYLNGPSLSEELRSRGRVDLATFRSIMAPICSALQLAHDRGIVHRDLKPSNIASHRYETGEVVWKVIDFGLANLVNPDDTPLTALHEFVGTAAYAAPEQVRGGRIDARTDIYGLGVIAYEMLAGQRPFAGEQLLELFDQHLNATPADLTALRADLPLEVTRGVMRALAKDPEERWPSAVAFGRALLDESAPTVSGSCPAAANGLLGTYELGPLIAHGRFGSEIHEGMHRALGHPVAIRTLRLGGRENRDAVRARFLREARALQVPHSNIVQVRDFGESGDLLYLVTDLLTGCSLDDALRERGPVPRAQLEAFVAQLADATAAIHRRGGLICGLHPGIVRIVRDEEGERLAISSAGICSIHDLLTTLDEATLRGQAPADGELQYVAPELLMGKPATPRADVFTIGVLAYQMATGRLPFAARSLPELLGAMLAGPPADPRGLRADLVHAQSVCILRCLAIDPSVRYEHAAAVRAAWLAASPASDDEVSA